LHGPSTNIDETASLVRQDNASGAEHISFDVHFMPCMMVLNVGGGLRLG
jgi:hypothetical protein